MTRHETEPPADAETPAVLRRRVLSLAWPVIGENMLETSLDIVNTVLVAGLGAAALAGVGSGLQIMFFVIAALSALSVGSSILVAQAVGARDLVRAGLVARQSMIWSGIFSVPLALVGFWLAGPIISIFGLEPDVAQIGTDYLRVAMGTGAVLVALLIGGGVLRGAGDSRTPMLVTMVANVVNVGLAYGLIFGHWGLPALGAVGSAWAAFMSRGLALALMLRALWRGRNGVSIAGPGGWRPAWPLARQVLGLGIPSSLEQVLLTTGFLVLTILVAHLGTAALAAQRIAISALSFSFLPGIGFGLAATALVGQSIGAGRLDSAAAVGKISTTWALIWMSGFGAIIFLGATPIMRLFSPDPAVIAVGAAGLRVMALTQPFWAVRMAGSGALRGTGDTRFPLVIGSLGVWGAVGLAWLLLRFIGGSLPGVWGAFLVTAPITAALTWWRFQRRIRDLAA
ncbi:MATE family efflux transporter [Oscillochloris sp. ZM17-4]|uniref:MATE family efflux transporter n=1 Tax=Oscillochloris sp. ZM17-4 TaxID=2866714 RepID=UPI001C735373|nr:MATE family efflux transporter [Oscillochloris sp. ZM17-4]MBX0330953.1 MATE family efflux transporter [Oscillochloris sp. ZM17-4]